MKKILIIFLCYILNSCSTSNVDNFATLLNPEDGKIKTDVLIVVKDGETIIEKYFHGYTASSKHISWSLAKTVTSLLIGRAITLGYLSLEDKISKFYPEFKGEGNILNLLNMSSGIDFKERSVILPLDEDITKFLYLEGPEIGTEKYILKLPLLNDKPGEYYAYSSGDTNLLLSILKKALPQRRAYDDWPWEELFNKLDADITFEQSSSGIFVGSAYLFAKPLDYIKFAKLILNKGKWNNEQLIDKSYIDLFYKVAPGVSKKVLEGSSTQEAYSLHLVTNYPIPGKRESTQYHDLSEDTLFSIGFQGQLMTMSRNDNMIILRLAADNKSTFNWKKFFQYINAFPSENLSPVNDIMPKKQTKQLWSFSKLHLLPKLLQRYAAKEICSCVFVLERSLDQCQRDLSHTLPYTPRVKIDYKSKTAQSSLFMGIWPSAAFYRSKRLGCYLPAQ